VWQPLGHLDFFFFMTTPGTCRRDFAYNSFAYQRTARTAWARSAAEPQKVGISVGTCDAASLGDFVWVDTNHNGVPGRRPTGLNNVYVRLLTRGRTACRGRRRRAALST